MNGLVIALDTSEDLAIGVLAVVVVAFILLVIAVHRGGTVPAWVKGRPK
jgi:hypothetical protein